MWFRRDLRLGDNPALLSAVSDGSSSVADHGVVPLFVLDAGLIDPAGPARRAYLAASRTDLGALVGGLQLRRGDRGQEVAALARRRARTGQGRPRGTTTRPTTGGAGWLPGPPARCRPGTRELGVPAQPVRHGRGGTSGALILHAGQLRVAGQCID